MNRRSFLASVAAIPVAAALPVVAVEAAPALLPIANGGTGPATTWGSRLNLSLDAIDERVTRLAFAWVDNAGQPHATWDDGERRYHMFGGVLRVQRLESRPPFEGEMAA